MFCRTQDSADPDQSVARAVPLTNIRDSLKRMSSAVGRRGSDVIQLVTEKGVEVPRVATAAALATKLALCHSPQNRSHMDFEVFPVEIVVLLDFSKIFP